MEKCKKYIKDVAELLAIFEEYGKGGDFARRIYERVRDEVERYAPKGRENMVLLEFVNAYFMAIEYLHNVEYDFFNARSFSLIEYAAHGAFDRFARFVELERSQRTAVRSFLDRYFEKRFLK